jgi:hypothetical protein
MSLKMKIVKFVVEFRIKITLDYRIWTTQEYASCCGHLVLGEFEFWPNHLPLNTWQICMRSKNAQWMDDKQFLNFVSRLSSPNIIQTKTVLLSHR